MSRIWKSFFIITTCLQRRYLRQTPGRAPTTCLPPGPGNTPNFQHVCIAALCIAAEPSGKRHCGELGLVPAEKCPEHLAGLSINWSLPKKRPLGIAIGTAELPPAQLKMSESLDHNLNKITSTKILASLQRRFKLFLSSSAIWLSFEVKRKEGLGAFLFKKKKKPSPLWKYFS